MKRTFFVLSCLAASMLSGGMAEAGDRYRERPPVLVSPDLSAPWVMQLRSGSPARAVPVPRRKLRSLEAQVQVQPAQRTVTRRTQARTVAYAPAETRRAMDPKFLPQQVAYDGDYKPGTIVIDTGSKFLYLIEGNGQARRYGVGVGKEGMVWHGTQTVARKAEWPDWRPPAEMIARERANGRNLPAYMPGGPANPLGARAMYLGDTLYRIHGTNAPWTIGTNVSSGCIRLRNEDVVDLYERVDVGAKVVVM